MSIKSLVLIDLKHHESIDKYKTALSSLCSEWKECYLTTEQCAMVAVEDSRPKGVFNNKLL